MAVITLDNTPAERSAYALGIRMACEIIEWRMDGVPWWLGPFTASEARQALVSLRQSADLISMEAAGAHCPATPIADTVSGRGDKQP